MAFLTLFLSLTISAACFALTSDDTFFNSLRTDNLNISKFETCDPSGGSQDGRTNPLPISWKPNGLGEYPQPPQCSSETLESQMLTASSEDARKVAVQKFFDTCGDRLQNFNHSSTHALAMFANAKYAYCNHPRVRRLRINFEDGTKLGGVIAIQRADRNGVDQPRPLVIYKCGVFCETEDSSTKLMVMHMFDQAPFNVIAIGNNTTADYTADNGYLAVGGYDEGMQLLRLAKLVRNSPLSKLTTSIHIIGMSLGGHAALMSSYLNEHNLDALNVPYYSSALALCPAVDLKSSIEYLFADNMRGKVSKEVLVKNVERRMADSPLLRQFYDEIRNAKQISLIPQILATHASDYYSRQPSGWALPPLDRTPIKDIDTLWKLNNFHTYATTAIHTPTFVFSATDDWVVVPEPNSVKLHATLENSKTVTSLKSVLVPSGNHCAFAPVYGYDTISRMYESFVMIHAPEMLARKHQVKQNFEGSKFFVGDLALKAGERYVRASLELKAGLPNAKIKVQIWGSDSWTDKGCTLLSVYDGKSKCLREAQAEVPLAALGPWARVPSTDPEAEQLTRWANYNLRYLTADGKPIIGGTTVPSALVWNEY